MNNSINKFGELNPTADLGLALDRANAVLTTLAACYDGKSSRFVVSDEFVVQAIASIETFVGQAKKSLDALGDAKTVSVAPSDFSTPWSVMSTANVPSQMQEPRERFAIGFAEEPAAEIHDVATTYDELMRKLTAAEVFASEGQANQHSNASVALVPLLKSLRNDLQKMRVA